MTTFVILAAGFGTRIGRVGSYLHKALVPLDGRAIISRQLDLVPSDWKIVICTGHRADQIKSYMAMAHPQRGVTYVDVDPAEPGSGPGTTLFAAKHAVEGSLVFTSCDTLWDKDLDLWNGDDESWVGAAPIPFGTEPERWCRVLPGKFGTVRDIRDKEPTPSGMPEAHYMAYVGLARIAKRDLSNFWSGLAKNIYVDGERQVTGGFYPLLTGDHPLRSRSVRWIDVGDAASYAAAVRRLSGYDFTKLNEATYVLPDVGRVVKFWSDPEIRQSRERRAALLEGAAPTILDSSDHLLAYQYTPGVVGYDVADAELEAGTYARSLTRWAREVVWKRRAVGFDILEAAGYEFYRDKTLRRIHLLSDDLRSVAEEAVSSVDWDYLASTVVPTRVHGDFNFGNVIYSPEGQHVIIDWREDFGGWVEWGDVRYDWAKLLGGTVVHWGRAQRGDFRPWERGEQNAAVIRESMMEYAKEHGGVPIDGFAQTVEIIGALALLNSAPLHAAPLDEVLVTRGVAWLREVV